MQKLHVWFALIGTVLTAGSLATTARGQTRNGGDDSKAAGKGCAAATCCKAGQAECCDSQTDAIRTKVNAAGDAAKWDSDAVVVLDHTDVLVRDTGIGETTTHRVVKVLREAAIRDQAVQRFDYDPSTNTLKLLEARVHRADGTTQEVPLDQARTQPEAQWGIFWGSRQVSLAVPRLNVGDAVEMRWIKTGFNVAYLAAGAGDSSSGGDVQPATEPPMPGHWYDEMNFWSSVPVIEKRYTVRIPRGKPLQFAVYNGQLRTALSYDGAHAVYSFEASNIPAFKGEGSMVSAGDVECKLVLATVADWKTKSRWFHDVNEKSLEGSAAIDAKVKEVVANCKNDEEKITALNHWVAENIRYVGTSRGACEGYTVHAARETFEDRGGVCKDKAAMLTAMLRSAGIDSYVVMTMAGAEVYPVPADQFNHCVTAVREKDGALKLLDPTWMPKSRDNWSTFAPLQHVVFGVPEGADLARSPYFPPEANLVTWSAASRIDSGGGLETRLSLTACGGPETNLRRAWAGRAPRDRAGIYADAVTRILPAATFKNVRAGDPVDFSGPIAFAADISAPAYVLGDGSRRYLRLPALRSLFGDAVSSDITASAGTETRKYPLKVRCTRKLSFEETLDLPAGWMVEQMPQTLDLDGPAAALHFEIEKSDGKVKYRCDFSLKQNKISPADYASYKQVVEAFNKLADASLVCRVEPSSAHR